MAMMINSNSNDNDNNYIDIDIGIDIHIDIDIDIGIDTDTDIDIDIGIDTDIDTDQIMIPCSLGALASAPGERRLQAALSGAACKRRSVGALWLLLFLSLLLGGTCCYYGHPL